MGLLVALAFLTRLPVPHVAWTPHAQAASLKWYPLVGALIGGLLACAGALLSWCLPPMAAAAVVLAGWAAITGALHLDGLADSADAWIGGLGDRERTLDIMKDPRCGPAGVMSLVLVSLLKFSALASLLAAAGHHPAWTLLLPPLLARAALIAIILWTPYVRSGGLASLLGRASPAGCIAALLLALVAAACFGRAGAGALAAMLLVTLLCRRAFMRRIGGFTGDVAGATVEMVEAAALLALL